MAVDNGPLKMVVADIFALSSFHRLGLWPLGKAAYEPLCWVQGGTMRSVGWAQRTDCSRRLLVTGGGHQGCCGMPERFGSLSVGSSG